MSLAHSSLLEEIKQMEKIIPHADLAFVPPGDWPGGYQLNHLVKEKEVTGL